MLAVKRASPLIDAAAYLKLQLDGSATLRVLDQLIAGLSDESERHEASHGLPEFLKKAAQRDDIADDELADRELQLLPLLGGVHGIRLRIYQILSRDPTVFVDAIRTIYKKKSEAKTATPLDENVRALARRNYELLLSWTHTLQGAGPPHVHENPGRYPFPGLNEHNELDEQALDSWVNAIRTACAAEERLEVADNQIGRILAYAPTDPNDGAWPHAAVRNIIEKYFSEELANGVMNEQPSKRGVFTKGVFEGGIQEDGLAENAKRWSSVTGKKWPKTTLILNRIAKMWSRWSDRADDEAAVRKLEGF
jgi:hypothetical protein